MVQGSALTNQLWESQAFHVDNLCSSLTVSAIPFVTKGSEKCVACLFTLKLAVSKLCSQQFSLV